MKKSEPNQDDGRLSKVLHEWKVKSVLPPRFQEGVWRQIENATPHHAGSIFTHWIGVLLPRPLLAATYIALLVVIGGTTGWTKARHNNERVMSELGDRYVRVLDPYQAPRE